MARTALITLICHDCSQSASVSSSKRRISAKPTLFTRQSTRPKRSSAASITRCGAPGCARSAATCRSPIPSVRRPQVTTRAPSSFRSRATSSPMPAVEPVTTQTLFVSPRSMAAATLAAVATTLLLARHGETDWNREKRWQGHADPPLNEAGREQARQLARVLSSVPLDAVYSSDLRRAYDTAEHRGGIPWARGPPRPRRSARSTSASGRVSRRTRSRNGSRRAGRDTAAGGDGWECGETHAAMSERILDAISEIARPHPEGHVLCVLHGGVIRALLAHAAATELGEYRRTQRGPVNGSVVRIAIGAAGLSRID